MSYRAEACPAALFRNTRPRPPVPLRPRGEGVALGPPSPIMTSMRPAALLSLLLLSCGSPIGATEAITSPRSDCLETADCPTGELCVTDHDSGGRSCRQECVTSSECFPGCCQPLNDRSDAGVCQDIGETCG